LKKKLGDKKDVFSTKVLQELENILNNMVAISDSKELNMKLELVDDLEEKYLVLTQYMIKREENIMNDTIFINNFKPTQNIILKPRPDLGNTVYEVVNKGCPNYFLNPECYNSFKKDMDVHRLISGQIVCIEDAEMPKNNQYKLPQGKIKLVTISN